MAFSVGHGLFTSSITRAQIDSIRHARTEKEACVMSCWEKIKAFFFDTQREEALRLLYRLIHPSTNPADMSTFVSQFCQLRNLAKTEHQMKFHIECNFSGATAHIAESTFHSPFNDFNGCLEALNNHFKNNYLPTSVISNKNLKEDCKKISYLFQTENHRQKTYDFKNKECSDKSCNELLKVVSDICHSDKTKCLNTLLVNTQDAFLAVDSALYKKDKQYPMYRDPKLLLTQQSRTHRQKGGSIIVQNHRCFISDPNDKSRINDNKMRTGVPPYLGKIAIDTIWMVTHSGIKAIALNLEVTPS